MMFGLVIRVALAWHLAGFYPTLDRCIAAQARHSESVCTDRRGEAI